MYAANRCKKLKIFVSQYKGKQQYYNFDSRNTEEFVFQSFQCQFRNKLYLYLQEQRQIIVSTTMDISNSLDLIFCLEIGQNELENIYNIKTIDQIVDENQKVIFNQIKKQSRGQLKPITSLTRRKNVYQIENIIKSKQPILNYYLPDISLKNIKKQQIWFVPRFMKDFQLEQGMIIRLYRKKIQQHNQYYSDDEQQIQYFQQLEVCQLSVQYHVQEVPFTSIKNNQKLSLINQMNLFHICDQYIQTSQVSQQDRITCYICLQSQQEKISKKVSPNLLFDPCGCTGGNKFAHLKCIITWINQKSIYENICCKICKKPYPQYVQINRIDLKKNKITRYFQIIGGKILPFIRFGDIQIKLSSNQEFFIGNESRSNIKVNLIERQKFNYAKIQYNAKTQKVYIYDLRSKYGTLIRKQKIIHKININQQKQTFTLLIKNRWLINITLIFK